jgi:outer membrane protein OmpA-like peptidoglycan-associated protein
MKLHSLVAMLILAVMFSQANAQKNKSEVKVKRSEFKTDKLEGFQEAWDALLEADDYYVLGKGSYIPAKDLYMKAHQYNSENPELNYKLGVCCLYCGDRMDAVNCLRKAFEKKPKISPDITFLLARAYHMSLDFDKAIDFYYEYRKSLGPAEAVAKYDVIDKYIAECKTGKVLVVDPKRVIISDLGDSINSIYDDYSSVLAGHDSVMYFTSRRPSGHKAKKNPFDQKYYEDIYVSTFSNGVWSDAAAVSKKVDGKNNDAVVGISNDNTKLLVYRGEEKGGDIYVSELKKGQWKSPVEWNGRFSSDESESSVYFTASGDTVYFISANKDITMGGRDLVVSYRNAKGKWTKPANLSSILNTKYDEEGLYLTPDGNTLYFSSKGHNTMGGFDVFKSMKREDGSWTEAENLGYPVNSPDDELFYKMTGDGKTAYISTQREGGLGGKDIYKLIFLGSAKEMLLASSEMLVAGGHEKNKVGFFTMPEPLSVDSFYYLKGFVLNKESKEPIAAKMEFVDSSESKVVATIITPATGEYLVKFKSPKKYDIEIEAKDYLFFIDEVDLSKAIADEPVLKDFLLDKIEVGTKVVLENINFQTSAATLTQTSYPKLDKIVTFLKNNGSIRVEISGHTDNVGSAKANLKLSEDRAKAVVDYMVSQGIDKSRLEPKGYGLTQPIAPNNTPQGREQNRRVEFKVISK